eukprot:Skav210247  [mRNA]  locus=scaffold1929:146250:147499:+ [translate_table: standard]
MCTVPLSALVSLALEDSNTNGAVLAEYFKAQHGTAPGTALGPASCEANGCKTKVIGAPKTIDGDLKRCSQLCCCAKCCAWLRGI